MSIEQIVPHRNINLTYKPSLAQQLGHGPAVVLTQIAFWVNRSNLEHDGAFYIWKTIPDMRRDWFPMFSESSIKRYLGCLIEQGLLRVAKLSHHSYDRTNYYTLTNAGAELLASQGIKVRDFLWGDLPRDLRTKEALFIVKNEPMEEVKMNRSKRSNWSDASGQNEPMQEVNLTSSTLYRESSDSTFKERTEEGEQKPLTEGEIRSHLLTMCRTNGEKKQQDAIVRLLTERATAGSLALALEWWRYDYEVLASRGEKPHWSQLAKSHEDMTRGKGEPPTRGSREDREFLEFLESRYGG